MRRMTNLASLSLITTSVLIAGVPAFITSSAGAANTYTLNSTHRQICVELGLTPEAMAALGVHGYQVSGIFSAVDDESGSISSMRSLQTQHQDALAALKSAQRSIRHAESQVEEQQIQADIDQLEAQITNARQSIDQTQASLRLAILPVGTNPQDVIRVCEPEGMAALVPVEFRFADLRDEDYIEIIAALAEEQRAIDNNELPDSSTQLTLSRYRNLPEVQQARSNLLYNLDAVRGVFSN